jgi:hypothetical protein
MHPRLLVTNVRTHEQARRAAELGAHAVGIVFVEGHEDAVEPEEGFSILSRLPPLIPAVGIFRDCDVDEFADVEALCPTASALFLGDEAKEVVIGCGPDIIKSVPVGAENPGACLRAMQTWASLEEVSMIHVPMPDGSLPRELLSEVRRLMENVSKPVMVGCCSRPQVEAVAEQVRPYAVAAPIRALLEG